MIQETLGDLYEAFLASSEGACEVIERGKHLEIPENASLLCYSRMKGDNSLFSSFVVLIPSLYRRISDAFASETNVEDEIKCAEIIGYYLRSVDGYSTVLADVSFNVWTTLRDGVSAEMVLTKQARIPDEFSRVVEVTTNALSALVNPSETLTKVACKTMDLMSNREQVLLSWLLVCLSIRETLPFCTVIQRCDMLVRVLAAGSTCSSRSFHHLLSVFALELCSLKLNDSSSSWFSRSPADYSALKSLLSAILPSIFQAFFP